MDDCFNAGGASSLERIGIEVLRLAQYRHDEVALAELEGELRCGEQARGALLGRAQLCCALQGRDRDSERAAPPRAAGCLLELIGDLFMGAADQCGAMPDAPVRLGAQYLGERLVHAAAPQQARALAYRRADQRVAEAHAMQVKVDNRGLGRRLEQIKPQRAPGNRARSLEDLAEALVVAVRCDQQKPPRRLRQSGQPGSEGLAT